MNVVGRFFLGFIVEGLIGSLEAPLVQGFEIGLLDPDSPSRRGGQILISIQMVECNGFDTIHELDIQKIGAETSTSV